MKDTLEQWRPVVGYEGLYEVSDLGRVKSLARVVVGADGRRRCWKERIRKTPILSNGYASLRLHKQGLAVTRYVHSLVAEAFIGPKPDSQVVCHGPGGALDNRVPNLRYGTYADNSEDMVRDGTHSRGERNYGARLKKAQVLEARRLVAAGPKGTLLRLAREYGVSRITLGDAVRGATWAWLDAA